MPIINGWVMIYPSDFGLGLFIPFYFGQDGGMSEMVR